MHRFVCFNRQVLPAADACLAAASSAALYGRGVFTTAAIRRGKPFQWAKHWRRLSADAQKINVDLNGFSSEKVFAALAEIIAANNIENARARITLFDESAGKIWQSNTKRQTSLLIQTADLRQVENDLRLTISPYRVNSTSPLAGVKSCNYLENLLAVEAAHARGFDEAVRLNENDEITSACLANVFWRTGEKLFTPATSTGCLQGTTRDFVIESAAQINLTVIETRGDLNAIRQADEVFLTSAGRGISSVKQIDEQFYGVEIALRLQKIFERI